MEEAFAPEDAAQQARARALFADHLHRPATIHTIELHGARNTRAGFLDPLFRPLVDPGGNAGTTLGDVIDRLEDLTGKLDRLDVFHPRPTIHLAEASQADPAAAADDVDVFVRVAEKSRLVFKAGTEVGNTEGGAYTNALLRNVLGGAETLSVHASAGTRTRSAYSATLSAPVRGNPDVRLGAEVLASSVQKPWASHDEAVTGGAVRLEHRTRAGDTHALAWAGTWRQLTGLASTASPTVRNDAGDSVKSCLSHTYTRDRRDNRLLPQRGYLVRTVCELAGWGPLRGDVSYSKTEVEVSGAVPLALPGVGGGGGGGGASVGGGLRLGLLYPLPFGYALGGPVAPSRINDRFQLGGPTDVRGFALGGLGPHDGPDSVGGDVLAAAGVHVLLPLPRAGPASPLRLQLFANGGRLVALREGGRTKGAAAVTAADAAAAWRGLRAAVHDLAAGWPSTAAGIGLVYAHPAARFELNFSLPLVLRRGESCRKGLQVGVGINFL